MDKGTYEIILQTADIAVKIIALVVGVVWATLVLREYKYRIQLDIDANLYKLSLPVEVAPFTRFSKKPVDDTSAKPHTYAVEVLLKFTNKGKVRFRLYNAQVGINTMRALSDTKFNDEDGHLHLTRIFTSGNVVPIFPVKDKPVEKTSFYYIEPGVEQTIHYLALITEPRELIQIDASFSLRQERFSLEDMRTKKGLYPHSAARTFQIDEDGRLITNSAQHRRQANV